MSEILKKIKSDLITAMKTEINIIKNPANGDFIISQLALLDVCTSQKIVSRSIISMFPSIGIKPSDATDDDVLKLVKKYISQEKERSLYQLEHLKEKDVEGKTAKEVKKIVSDKIEELGDSLTSYNIILAKKYLPEKATEEEIISWIQENIDFSKLENKMQAMGPTMKQFKGSDGNFVKNILMKF